MFKNGGVSTGKIISRPSQNFEKCDELGFVKLKSYVKTCWFGEKSSKLSKDVKNQSCAL